MLKKTMNPCHEWQRGGNTVVAAFCSTEGSSGRASMGDR
jgi:hypothetical protein